MKFEHQKEDLELFAIEKNIPFRTEDNSTCMYCPNSLADATKEHTFNSAWGGTHSSTKVICSSCNTEFSNIDSTFQPYIQFIMNAWGFRAARQKEVPVLATSSGYNIKAGGIPSKTFEMDLKLQEDNSIHISATGSSKSNVRKQLLETSLIADKIGRELTEDEKQQISTGIRNSKFNTDVDTDLISFNLELNIQYEIRSVVHTTLKCLALFDPSTVQNPSLDKAKRFARYNEGNWEDFCFNINPDTITEEIIMSNHSKSSIHFNKLDIIYSPKYGIVALLTILGSVKRGVVLSKEYIGLGEILSIYEVSNPAKFKGILQTRKWTSKYPIPLIRNIEKANVEQFYNELGEIASKSMNFDAPLNAYNNALETLIEKHSLVTEDFASAFIEILTKLLTQIVHSNAEIRQIHEIITKHSLDPHTNFLGMEVHSDKFQELVTIILENSLKEIHECFS